MPSLNITSNGNSSYTFTIYLSSPFNTKNYISAGISTRSLTSSSYQPLSFVTVSATVSYTNSSVSMTAAGNEGQTYYAWAQAANGLYYSAGSCVCPADTGSGSQGGSSGGSSGGSYGSNVYASEFQWWYSHSENGSPVSGTQKLSGQGFYLGANEWNSLMLNISQIVAGRLGQTFSYTAATRGGILYATDWNNIWIYLGRCMGSDNYYSSEFRYSGDPIKAADLNYLVIVVNSLRTG